MIILALASLAIVAILAVFFYRTADMDIVGAIIAAVVSAGVLALLVTGAIYVSELFRAFQ